MRDDEFTNYHIKGGITTIPKKTKARARLLILLFIVLLFAIGASLTHIEQESKVITPKNEIDALNRFNMG